MKRIPRIGWLIAGIPKCSVESVAKHSFFVVLLAYLISSCISNINKEKLLKLSLIHDIPEAIVHDIGGMARELIPRDVRKKAELEGLLNITEEVPDEIKKR